MELRHITKEDLPKLAELISCDELATRDDISFDHSAVAIDDNGVIVAFVIMRQRSLQDFFGGRIPDEIITEDDEDYMEGDEYAFRNEVEENFSEEIQYELIYSYQSESDKPFDHNICKCYDFASKDDILVWDDNRNRYIVKVLMSMGPSSDFNGQVSVDFPYYE